MHLHGYDEQTGPAASVWTGDDRFSAELLAEDFDVDLAVARRAVEQKDGFAPQPSTSSLVVDGTPMLKDPVFWAAHLAGASRGRAEIAAACGTTWEQAREAKRSMLFRPEAWPVFTVPLPTGAVVVVVYRTDAFMTLDLGCVWVPDQEYRVDFWLAPRNGPGLNLATRSGHPRGPGLSWPELRAIAGADEPDDAAPDDAAPDRLTSTHRLLLLAPILGDRDAGDEAVDRFARALSRIGGRHHRTPDVRSAAATLAHNDPARWWSDADGWICDGVVSGRNPAGHHAFPPDDLRRVSAALNPGQVRE